MPRPDVEHFLGQARRRKAERQADDQPKMIPKARFDELRIRKEREIGDLRARVEELETEIAELEVLSKNLKERRPAKPSDDT